jgi:hypothetical protein
MKTILVVYTQKKVVSSKELKSFKKYAFNTADDLKEGDMIASSSYNSPLQVVKVLDEAYSYYNASTGELSNKFNSTAQWEIKVLAIREEDAGIVYGSLIKQ